MNGLTIVLIIIGGVTLISISTYNKFIRIQNSVNNSWAGINVQLKRRSELIPNLINTVKGYAKHEKVLLENIAKSRVQMITGLRNNNIKKAGIANSKLDSLLHGLFMIAENYPNLKSNQNFLDLQKELTNTEDEIAASRRIYNENVTYYNNTLQIFPNNIFSGIFKFKPGQLFEIEEYESKNVMVKH